MNMLCTILAVLAIFSRYRLSLKWKIQKKLLIPSDTLFTTKEYQNIILEVFIMSLAPIAGLQDTFIPEFYPDWPDPTTGLMGAPA